MGIVDDAVILAGGMGTRMLPASLYAPKETMPLVDTPILNHLIWEAAKAGVSRVHLVLSEGKRDLLEKFLQFGTIHGDEVRVDLPRESISLGVEGVEIIPHIQANPGGVADAISVAIESIEGPFLVLLGDMLMIDKNESKQFSRPSASSASSASMRLVSSFESSGLPLVGVFPVEISRLSNYGVVELSGDMVLDIVEKPQAKHAKSNYILCGRYLLPGNTREILTKFPISEYGELQSIFLLRNLIETSGLNAVKLDSMNMYDSGEPISWLKAQIDHSLRRDDMRDEMRKWINHRINQD